MAPLAGLSRLHYGLASARHPRRSAERQWQLGKGLCALQACLGQALTYASIMHLQGATAALGLLLGISVTVTACVGVSGCVFRDLTHLAANLVGGVLCTALVFGLVAQVASLARTDCALAQLRLMDERTAAAIGSAARSGSHLASAVQLRLAALDSTLDALQQDAALLPPPGATTEQERDAWERLHKTHARELWRATDAHFVERKAQELRQYGEQLLERLWSEDAQGALGALQERVGQRLSPADQRELVERFSRLFDAVTAAVRRVEEHVQGSGPELAPDEYGALVGGLDAALAGAAAYVREVEQVLGPGGTPLTDEAFQALVHGPDAASAPPGQGQGPPRSKLLHRAHADIALMREALGRQQSEQGYSAMPIGDAGAVRAAWRGHWNALLEAGAAQALERSAALSAGGLEGMPEQCLEVLRDEQRGERLLVRAAVALVVVQAASTWAVWGAALQQAEKLRSD